MRELDFQAVKYRLQLACCPAGNNLQMFAIFEQYETPFQIELFFKNNNISIFGQHANCYLFLTT